MTGIYNCKSPGETFALGQQLGEQLVGGEILLLSGGLGAGKTLLTKGILEAVGFDIDEVTSPSFALVNLYKTNSFNVYHIDLWRMSERGDIAFEVGLGEILEDENAVVIIEWAEKLQGYRTTRKTFEVEIKGDGDEPRRIKVDVTETSGVPANRHPASSAEI